MAFDKQNTRFYYDITDEFEKITYRLFFLPGHNSDSTGFTDVQIPETLILPDTNIKSAFEEKVPTGMLKAAKFKLKFRFDNFVDVGANNWSNVREWIKEGQSNATRSVNGRDIYIPNVWWLISDYGGTNESTEYIGVQMVRPKKKTTIGTIEVNFEIELMSLEMYLGLNALIEDLTAFAETIHTYAYNLYYQRTYYAATQLVFSRTMNDITNIRMRFMRCDFIPTQTGYILTNIIRALQRVPNTTFWTVSVDNPEQHKTYYRQNYNQDGLKGTALNSTNTKIISRLVTGNSQNVIGGLYSSKSNFSLYEYKNLWNLFREWWESNFIKGGIETNWSSGIFTFKAYRLYDSTTSRTVQDKTITTADIIGNLEILEGDKTIGSAITHVKNIHSDDPGEIEYTDENISLNEDTREPQRVFHNHPVTPDKAWTRNYDRHKYIPFEFKHEIVRNIYYLGSIEDEKGRHVRVHDYVDYDLGNSKTISPKSTYGDIPLPIFVLGGTGFKEWIADRLSKSGDAYVCSKAYYMLLGDKTHAISIMTLPASKALPSHMGDIYTINLTNLLPAGYTGDYNHISDQAILVDLDWDIHKGISKCYFFHLPKSLEDL